MSSLLDRFLAGEQEEVWDEIYDLDSDGPLGDQITEVAMETMSRVRRNLAKIVERLKAKGFVFNHPDEALRPPPENVEALLNAVDRKTARVVVDGFSGRPLPASVRQWYRTVGSVDLSGYDPKWPRPKAKRSDHAFDHCLGDGLVVQPLENLVEAADELPAGGASLMFSPDIFHKEGISGGPPYAFDVVSPSADAFCTQVETAFVPYLRWSLEWAGFPGLRLYQNVPKNWVRELKEDLEAF